MPSRYPTKRPTDADYLDEERFDRPVELLNLPWIDIHNHAQTLSWEDRERYALAGCRAMILVASGYHWTPYKPVAADDIRYLWDDVINRRRAIERNHFFDANLALGIHTGVRVDNTDELFDVMGEYCELDEVVAVGETGITPAQHVCAWDRTEQRAVVETQMELASAHDLPVILHTPSSTNSAERNYRPGVRYPGFEKNTSLAQQPVIDAENAALEAVTLDIEAADDTGLSDEQIVASHADPNNIQYLMENTDCYVSFTIGHSWLTGVTPADVAEAIGEYGPDRIMIDTDCANVLRTDVFSMKRAIFELYRLGVSSEAIRQVVLQNPRRVFEIGV